MGPLSNGIGIIWKDLAIYVALELGLGSYSGTTPQPLWPYLATMYPHNALAYQGTAYLWGAGYNLGDSASIGNHNVEIYGPFAGTGANGIDADPALVINDFLTNAQYGAQFNPASIDAHNAVRLGRRCVASDLLQGDGLRLLAGAGEPGARIEHPRPLAADPELRRGVERRPPQVHPLWRHRDLGGVGNELYQRNSRCRRRCPRPRPHSSRRRFVTVRAPQNFVSDGGVVYAFNNIPFVFIGAEAPTAAGTYGMISPGQYIFAAADYGQPVRITWIGAPSTSYVPNLTPVYELTDLDYVDEKGNKDPLQVERVDVYSLPTIQRITVSSRANQYASTPVEARDQSQIEIFGPRVGSTISAMEVCDEIVIGPLMAQAILQRELYVRTKFTFKTELGILPARSDGHRDLDGYEPRAFQLSGPHH